MIKTPYLGLASEKGKMIINECLDRGYWISAIKLEKLLIIAHGTMLSEYQKTLFDEDIVSVEHGLIIPETEKDFLMNDFKEKMYLNIPLLQIEKIVINNVLEKYAHLDFLKLNALNPLRVLHELSYKEGEKNLVSNRLIKDVFGYYAPYDFDSARENEKSFQKSMINRYVNK